MIINQGEADIEYPTVTITGFKGLLNRIFRPNHYRTSKSLIKYRAGLDQLYKQLQQMKEKMK